MWQIQISSILRGLSIYALQILTVLPWYFVAIVGGGGRKVSGYHCYLLHLQHQSPQNWSLIQMLFELRFELAYEI